MQPTRESKLPFYGTIGGKGVPNQPRLYQIEKVLEKPTPTIAEQELIVPGLRAGHYLCFFGMHVLTSGIMEILAAAHAAATERLISRSRRLCPNLASREKYLAYEVEGRRYNLGEKFGIALIRSLRSAWRAAIARKFCRKWLKSSPRATEIECERKLVQIITSARRRHQRIFRWMQSAMSWTCRNSWRNATNSRSFAGKVRQPL